MNNIRDLNNLFLYGRSNLIDYNTHQTKKKIRNLTKEKINMIILTSKLIKLTIEELLILIEQTKQDIEENKKNGN